MFYLYEKGCRFRISSNEHKNNVVERFGFMSKIENFRFCFRQLFIQMDSRGQGIVGFPLLQAALYVEYCIYKQIDARLQPLIRTKV